MSAIAISNLTNDIKIKDALREKIQQAISACANDSSNPVEIQQIPYGQSTDALQEIERQKKSARGDKKNLEHYKRSAHSSIIRRK